MGVCRILSREGQANSGNGLAYGPDALNFYQINSTFVHLFNCNRPTKLAYTLVFRHNISRIHSYFNISTFFSLTPLTSPASSFVNISSYSQALVSQFKLKHTVLASTGFAFLSFCSFTALHRTSYMFVHSRVSLKQ